MNLKRRTSGSYDDMSAIPAKSKHAKLESGDPASTSVKRSPVIKISYKDPGGKGKVMEIPSKVHSPELHIGENAKTAIQERARNALKRAKSQHAKFMKNQKDNKQTISQENIKNMRLHDVEVATTANLGLHGKESLNTLVDSVTAESEAIQEINHSGKELAGKVLMEQESDKTDPVNSSKRLLRSLAPHVLISPLSKTLGDEGNSSSPTLQRDVNMPSLSPKKRDPSKFSHTITVTRCTTREGVQWCQGDVVWAKIHGFPWWPGLLQRIIVKTAQNSKEQIAIVDWFQSKTISHIPCSQLESFSGNFKKR